MQFSFLVGAEKHFSLIGMIPHCAGTPCNDGIQAAQHLNHRIGSPSRHHHLMYGCTLHSRCESIPPIDGGEW